jgi:hypothetical protein
MSKYFNERGGIVSRVCPYITHVFNGRNANEFIEGKDFRYISKKIYIMNQNENREKILSNTYLKL